MAERRLSVAEAAAYWEDRHRRADDLRSGGHIGLDYASNELFYARRLGALLEIAGDQASASEPLSVLDAGCGKGHFARAMARCGHRVDAIDAAVSAIEHCRAGSGQPSQDPVPPGRAGEGTEPPEKAAPGAASQEAAPQAPGPHWAVCTLSGWTSPWLYDLVYSIDVLFHILDDAEWAASAGNLASLVRYGGTLVVTDEDAPARAQRGSYILHRTRGEYQQLLCPRGLRYEGFRPYAFRDNQVGFHVFTRTH